MRARAPPHGARDEKHKREEEEKADGADFWAAAVTRYGTSNPLGPFEVPGSKNRTFGRPACTREPSHGLHTPGHRCHRHRALKRGRDHVRLWSTRSCRAIASRVARRPEGLMARAPRALFDGRHGLARRRRCEPVSSTSPDGEFFWLDLHGAGAGNEAMLEELFGFHPLALEDAEHFGQRPKLDEYDDFLLLVAYGANADRDGLVEVHCFHLRQVPGHGAPRRLPGASRSCARARPGAGLPPAVGALLLHSVLDALVDSFFPELAKLDDRIDELETGMLQARRRATAGDLPPQAAAHHLAQGRHPSARPARAPGQRRRSASPGMTPDMERYYRDLYDHLIRINDLPGQLPRPAHRRHGRLSLDGLEPAQRGDEAAHHRGHGVHAAHLDRRVLRHELRLDGAGLTGWPAFLRRSAWSTQVAAVLADAVAVPAKGWI